MTTALQQPTGEFFQLGYVTADLENAMATYREQHGIERFALFDNRAVLKASGSDEPFIRIALAYLGPVMVELIEPEPGRDSIYKHAVRADGGIALHHLGYMVEPEAFAGLESNLVTSGVDVPVVRRGGLALLYADTRPTVGLYSEFVRKSPEVDAFFADVPHYGDRGAGIVASGAQLADPDVQVELAKRLLNAVGRFDVDALQEMMTDDATWWSFSQGARENAVAKAPFLDGFEAKMKALFASSIEFTIVGITANGDRVAIEANSAATLVSGKSYANKYHYLFEFRDGRISRVREYMDTAYMRAAFAQ